ncbi:hypothetical protein SKAU_G00313220 [Synaphobranchus kaupii]|uniref:Ornithine decarboxylase antizyme 2 n=1 Tax=Synaphobranchus kaupii TaxID=118154 RepID=A0A9Q1IL91_SYNKA|nr:hypothetical protein SKAU_G00313220 [Synaphobranchus kaupii]
MVNCSVELLLNSHCFGCQRGYNTFLHFPEVNMLNTEESTSLKIPGGRGISRDHSLNALLHKDERLTVTQAASANGTSLVLHFQYQLSERRTSCWETVFYSDSLFLEIPEGSLPEGSKEGLTSLLEFAEEKLKASYVFLWFNKSREDRLSITKTFHYMGFEIVKPGHPLVPARADLVFMVYSLDQASSDEE